MEDTDDRVSSNSLNNWKPHLYRAGVHEEGFDQIPEEKDKIRKHIEPWLSAVFQSEHLSLLIGNGFTVGIAKEAGGKAVSMETSEFPGDFGEKINAATSICAKKSGRDEPNFEDYIRVANELLRGLEILGEPKADELRGLINERLGNFLRSILESEQSIFKTFSQDSRESLHSRNLLVSFLLSFTSRAASRERLNLFTTNYDRLIEYGCDLAGLRVVDRFIGTLTPVFRASRLNIDLHYNPPGIRGEPRYLEGVIRLFKLHGSLDWRLEDGEIRRYGIPFGAPSDHQDLPKDPLNSVMIYPNAAKDVETSEYPYAELFRDFASAICRPNSVLVTYGYSYGDDHINRVIRDMLTILSTHLVIISYSAMERIKSFCSRTGHKHQISLLLGSHFGCLPDLVEHYLPKSAIDLISARQTELLKRRGIIPGEESRGNDPGSLAPQEGGNHANAD